MKLTEYFIFGLQNGFCDFDSFGTDVGALEVALATPDSMGLFHYLHPIQDIFHLGIKNVALSPQHYGGADELWFFFKDYRTRSRAAGTHDAFYGVVK